MKKISISNKKNLVFGGAGAHAVIYLGIALELQTIDDKFFSHIEKVCGSSSGSWASAMIAVGYSPEEVKKLMFDVNFGDFADAGATNLANFGTLQIINVLTEEGVRGINSGAFLRKWVDEKLQEKTGISNMTFRDLANLRARHPEIYKDLYVVASDLTDQKPVVFSFLNSPDMSISTAVRASAAFPVFFQECIDERGHEIVDGGLYNCYPIDVVGVKDTIGFKFRPTRIEVKSKLTAAQYITVLLLSGSVGQDEKDSYLTSDTISIELDGLKLSMNLDITNEEKEQMVATGKDIVSRNCEK